MSRGAYAENLRERLDAIIIHIQNNLDEELTLEKVAAIANLSPFHFHRLFRASYNQTLHDYVKRLRLEKAAFMINHSNTPITEISYSTGYGTPSSFSKAFKLQFGVTPRTFRNTALYASNTATYEKKKDQWIKPEIKNIADQYVLFHRETGQYQSATSRAWRKLMMSHYSSGFINEHSKAIGIAYDSPYITECSDIRYDACITVTEEVAESQLTSVQKIPGGRFAIFSHTGSYKKIDAMFDLIYGTWLPQSGHKLRDQITFCHYHQIHTSNTPEELLRTDIYIPLT
ncbi:GyrI-like domain-containing protein [Pseudomonadota bacterium]